MLINTLGMSNNTVLAKLNRALNAIAVTMISQLPLTMVSVAMVSNVLKSLIGTTRYLSVLVVLDYILRLLSLVAYSWSTGIY